MMTQHANVTIQPVLGGFVVHYPKIADNGDVKIQIEVATSVGKAMRIAKAAVEEFSLVAKATEEYQVVAKKSDGTD